MIIDIHAHVYIDPKIRLQPETTPHLSAAEQIALMNRMGIDKAVILPVVSPEPASEKQSIGEVLQICRNYPDRFIPFCNIDPRLTIGLPRQPQTTDFDFILNQYKDLGCKGIGEMTARVPWDDAAMLKLLAATETLSLPIIFHSSIPDGYGYGIIDEVGLPRLEKVLKRFPGIIFIGHSPGFWSEISGQITLEDKCKYPEGPVKPGGAVPRLLRQYPNLCCDISAGSGLNAFRRDPEHAYKFIEEFQDRILFGLDYCSINDDRQHLSWLQNALNQGSICQEAYEKITWKNVNRILNLNIDTD